MLAKIQSSDRSLLLVGAGIFLGLGLGGFFDGIVLHQILQWHHMFSSIRPLVNFENLDLNSIGDGLFHVLDFLFTVVGIILLWRAGGRDDIPWSLSTFVGSILCGAGIFNLVEGIIDHQILGIHHVKPGPHQLAWDLGFLGIGALLAIAGWVVLKKEEGRRKKEEGVARNF